MHTSNKAHLGKFNKILVEKETNLKNCHISTRVIKQPK